MVSKAVLAERRRIIELARKLGEELVENGKALCDMHDVPEGRLRQLAGMLFYELAECLCYDTSREAREAVMAAIEKCKEDPSTAKELIKILKAEKRYRKAGGCSW